MRTIAWVMVGFFAATTAVAEPVVRNQPPSKTGSSLFEMLLEYQKQANKDAREAAKYQRAKRLEDKKKSSTNCTYRDGRCVPR